MMIEGDDGTLAGGSTREIGRIPKQLKELGIITHWRLVQAPAGRPSVWPGVGTCWQDH